MAPFISLIVVNFNGRSVLPDCLASLAVLDWPRGALEVLLVDNASSDGSPKLARDILPDVRVLPQTGNLGFAPACNVGARLAQGQYLAFLNNDARVPANWLRAMIAPFAGAADDLACVGSTMLNWDGRLVDFVGGALNPNGRAFQVDQGLPYEPARYRETRDLLFACGGAMLIRRDVYLDVGGFDDDFVAYFEDVDLGWRLWLMGYRVLLAPDAIAYHRLHATGRRLGTHRRYAISELNALRMVVKNYSDENFKLMLAASLLSSSQRAALHGQILGPDYAFPGPIDQGGQDAPDALPPRATSYIVAMSRLAGELPRWMEKRAAIQARRVRSDAEIFNRFPMAANNPLAPWRRNAVSQQDDLKALGAPAYLQPKLQPHLLIVSHETIGPKMAGPGVRCLEMARALAAHGRVTLAAPGQPQADELEPGLTLFGYHSFADLEPAINAAGAVLAVGQMVSRVPRLRQLDRPLIVDWYDPFEIEKLAMVDTVSPEYWALADQESHLDLNLQAQAGDFYLCASERQRDLWLGLLLASGRLSMQTAAADQTVRSLIDVVPFGLPSAPPRRTGAAIKGCVPGIEPADKVLYWGGGLWQWFDPLSLIEAMPRITAQRADAKLFFAAGLHFDTKTVPAMPIVEQVRARATELGLLGRSVFIGDWIPYAERANYLLDADLGLSLHRDGLESRYAFRTRLLDYFWAGLPMVVTTGDPLAELVAQNRLGCVVPPADVDALVRAVLDMLGQENPRAEMAARFAAVAQTFTWERVVEPVARFMRQPRFAPDAGRALERLDPAVRVKHLEETLRSINQGRVMRVLRWVDRIRGLG